MNSGTGWLRWALIALCSSGIALSTGCKESGSKTSTPKDKKSGTSQKTGGEKGKDKKDKKDGGKKSGAKKGGKKGAKGNRRTAKENAAAAVKPEGGKGSAARTDKGARGPRPASPDGKLPPLEGITFDVPDAWKPGKPDKILASLRASYEVPAADNATGQTMVTIHYQPEAKSKAKETLNKLMSRVKPAEGETKLTPTITEETTPNGLKITVGSAVGTLAEQAPTANSEKAEPLRIIVAVIEDPKGPHTVRVTGPKAVVDGATDSIMEFVRSAKAKE